MHIQLEKHRANIHYIGDNQNFNETIVFIPGAGMDHRTAQMVGFDNLKKAFNILAIDLPGHGYTTGNQLSTIEEYSNFCIDVMDYLSIKNPVFIGHSMGGLIALDLSTKIKDSYAILLNTAYPLMVGEILLKDAKGNLDQAAEFLTKHGVYNLPEVEIKSSGFGVMGSGFYGRSKGTIKSPYGTKNVEADPNREIMLYPLKKLFNQSHKEILSIDLKACSKFKLNKEAIKSLSNIKFVYGAKDKLARFNDECELLYNFNIDFDIYIMEETGHFPFFENNKKLNKLIEEIINKIYS
jgi:pimeloyl-ACP methyl ester carboxylesterase